MTPNLKMTFSPKDKGFFLVGFNTAGEQVIDDGMHDTLEGATRAKKIWEGISLPSLRNDPVVTWRIIQILDVPESNFQPNQNTIDTLNSIL